MKQFSRHLTLAAVSAAALAACGGGGGGSDTPAAPTSGPITLGGTAAKGAALAGASISAKCATGSGTATADANGVYTLAIANAALPCVLRATGAGADSGLVFHSVVAGTGISGTFVANVTPLSELVTANLAGAAPATYFDAYAGAAITATNLTAAIDYLKTAVAGITDLGSANPLTDALVVGNALDQKIDALMNALADASLTLAEVSAAVVANPSAPAVVAAPLAPAATGCAWLKSGDYRVINPYETDPRWKAHVLAIDAATLTATDQDNATSPFAADGDCQYSVSDGEYVTKVMVAPSGVLVMFSEAIDVATQPQRSIAIGLPEQTLPLSELAGTWNGASFDPASGIPTPGFVALTQELTFSASGSLTANQLCVGTAACTSEPGPFASFTANANGGFNIVEEGNTTGSLYLFKTLSGQTTLVAINNDGQFTVGTRKAALGALPEIGTVSYFREFNLNGNGTISALTENNVTVTARDTTANTITRIRASDSRVDTLAVNSPRVGVRYRALNSCNIGGTPSNCSETVQVPLQGLGITMSLSVGVTNPATAFYNVSVNRPVPVN